jgi:hypothetical protein
MSSGYRIQNRTRDRLADLNIRVSKKKSRYRRQEGIELNELIQTKKPDSFTSRKEVEKYVRDMEKFLDRKTQFVQNKNNVIFDRKTVEKYNKEIERVNKIKERELNRVSSLETQVKGKKLGLTVGERLRLAPKSLFPNLAELSGGIDRFSSEKELRSVLKDQFKEGYYRGNFIKRADRQYKQNFIESLETVFGNKSRKLRNYIKRLNINDFMNVYYETTGSIDIDYVYDDDEQATNKLQILERTFGI